MESSARPMAILLIEDEPQLRRGLAKSLSARGHTVAEAGTVREGLEAAISNRPDLLLLDINLPDGTGWDVLRQLRAAGQPPPSIVFSAVPPSPSRVREFEPIGVLHKPFPVEALIRMVSTVGREGREAREEDEE